MGFRVSWIAFEGLGRQSCLDLVGMVDTGELDDACEAPFSMAVLPTGWGILFSNDFTYASDDRLSRFSGRCRIVGCQIEETIMYCRAAAYENGKLTWSAAHDSNEGLLHLETSGALPKEFEEIQRRLLEEQEQGGGESSDTDYVFDIPIESAAALTGYRHDKWKFDWGEPAFTALAGTITKKIKQPFWKKLLGTKS